MSWFSRIFGGNVQRDVVLSQVQRQTLEAWQRLPAPDLSRLHNQGRYVVVDVESSGLNMKKDRLISIGAVSLVDGQMDFNDAFQIVLRQDQVSTNENILIHGIGGSAQSEGVDPVEALLAFLGYIGKAPLVAYHAFFDQSMIDKAMSEYLGMKLGQVWIDLAWILPEFFQYRSDGRVALDDWLKHFEIENILRHNAVSDAYATAKLLQIAIAHGTHKGAGSPASFVKIEKARRWMHDSR
jgi:DNA polymerase III subunit epsilon